MRRTRSHALVGFCPVVLHLHKLYVLLVVFSNSSSTAFQSSKDQVSKCDGEDISYLGRKVNAEPVVVEDLAPSERYSSVVKCRGEYFLVSRKDLIKDNIWSTVVRKAESPEQMERPDGLVRFRFPSEPVELIRNAHNNAPICIENHTLQILGGQDRNGTHHSKPWNGIFTQTSGVGRVTADITDLNPNEWEWEDRGIVFDGDSKKNNCFEVFNKGTCLFDGKFSLVRYRGQLLIYGRANMKVGGGGRWAQVAKSSDGGKTFGHFELVKMPGVDLDKNTNFYFFFVEPFFDHRTKTQRLVALIPGVLNGVMAGERLKSGTAGIHMSVSDDGIHFSPPSLIMTSFLSKVRTSDYPVSVSDLLGRRGVSFIVQRNVQILGAQNKHTYFCRYSFQGTWG
mmetsp:Transcript_58135/g.131734  ORF Transcript_58135/g.131734 Transcript_58135/m.131734 type:complete len:395 (-) Transcript_58135:190-1374(-)